MMENTTFLHQKCGSKFICQVCHFKCSKKGDYKRHIDSINLVLNEQCKDAINFSDVVHNLAKESAIEK